MKIKTRFLSSIAVLAVIVGAGATAFLLNNSKITDKGSSAAEGRRVAVTVKGGLEAKESNAWGYRVFLNLEVDVNSAQDVKAGDYFDIKLRNVCASTESLFHNKDVKESNQKAIGRSVRISVTTHADKPRLIMPEKATLPTRELTPNDYETECIYRITFNEVVNDLSSISLNFKTENIYQPHPNLSSKAYDYNATMSINDREVASIPVRAAGMSRRGSGFGYEYSGFRVEYNLDADDNILVGFAGGSGGNHIIQLGNNPHKFAAGDIFTFELTDLENLWKINTVEKRQYLSGSCNEERYNRNLFIGDNHNDSGLLLGVKEECFKYTVIEQTDGKIILRIDEAGDGFIQYPSPFIISPKDRSRIIDRDAQGNIVALSNSYRHTIVAADSTEKLRREARFPALAQKVVISSGAAVVAVKRGSLNLEVKDEYGRILRQKEVVKNRVVVGEKYSIEMPEITGYEFDRLQENSAPLSGEIAQGEQDVVLIYRISRKSQTVKIGENPDPRAHIPDFDKNFEGCEVAYKDKPDTSKKGEVGAILVISCPDMDDREITVKIFVEGDDIVEENPDSLETPNTGFGQSWVIVAISAIVVVGSVATAIFIKK